MIDLGEKCWNLAKHVANNKSQGEGWVNHPEPSKECIHLDSCIAEYNEVQKTCPVVLM